MGLKICTITAEIKNYKSIIKKKKKKHDKIVLLAKSKLNRIEVFKETGYSRYIYQNEVDKACFQHDMAYAYFKDLPRRTASEKA